MAPWLAIVGLIGGLIAIDSTSSRCRCLIPEFRQHRRFRTEQKGRTLSETPECDASPERLTNLWQDIRL